MKPLRKGGQRKDTDIREQREGKASMPAGRTATESHKEGRCDGFSIRNKG